MPAKPNVSLRGLRTFCVAARHESFREAAEDLFITPSAVSHQIKSLEKELGQQLFERNARELRLTDVGRSLYEEAGPLIAELGTVVASYKLGARRPPIRMSVQPFFGSEYFVPKLSEFTTAHPEIEIQVATSDESSEAPPADVDLVIRLFREPPANMMAHVLFPLRLAVAGSPDFKKKHPVKGKRIVSDFPLIIHQSYPRAWQEWSRASGIQIPEDARVTRLDSMIAVVRACERGIGAALVPVPVASLWFKYGSIVRLFPDELIAEVSYYLLVRDDRAEDPDVALLKAWILDNFSGEA